MVFLKTRVVNKLKDVDLVLKIASSSVFSTLAPLKRDGGKFDITVNTNRTNTEYWIVGESLSGLRIVISTDDAVEYGEIQVDIVDNKYDVICIPRKTNLAKVNGFFGRLLMRLGLQN